MPLPAEIRFIGDERQDGDHRAHCDDKAVLLTNAAREYERRQAPYHELRSLGAQIVEPLEKKPWVLRQFTVEDLDGNRFYFHSD